MFGETQVYLRGSVWWSTDNPLIYAGDACMLLRSCDYEFKVASEEDDYGGSGDAPCSWRSAVGANIALTAFIVLQQGPDLSKLTVTVEAGIAFPVPGFSAFFVFNDLYIVITGA